MHIHILGICGTFMGGLAMIARQAGFQVSGSDQGVYPPMSTQLEQAGISLHEGYLAKHIDPSVDLYIIGNALSRGNEMVEAILDQRLPYQSGPQWLYEQVLRHKWVLAVAGTHGKTTTSSMLAWILEYADLNPGYLIGGVPQNFGVSARLTDSPFFVIEADEYDTAFFDKRSKFVHYHPSTLILNNLEFDHADIFKDLDAIKTQFHHLIRIVPGNGQIISNAGEKNLDAVLQMGLWTKKRSFSSNPCFDADWQIVSHNPDCSEFRLRSPENEQFKLSWQIIGEHNMSNALAAIAAAQHAGVPVAQSVNALPLFKNVKRRMECLAKIDHIFVYDDFAHHPTAIKTTLSGLRAKVADEKIIAVLEPRSNTMKMGVHKDLLVDALQDADQVIMYQAADLKWSLQEILVQQQKIQVFDDINAIIKNLIAENNLSEPCHILIMSNGSFNGLHQKLIKKLEQIRGGEKL